MEDKKYNENIRWGVHGIGNMLIKSVSFSFGGITTTTYHCSSCGEDMTFHEPRNIEFEKLYRELAGGKGNLNLCFECDSKDNKIKNEKIIK